MKKGFTLIELLAVIVILAIIALIAVPIVLNIIDETKDNATLRSADFYLDAVEMSIAQSTLKNQNVLDGTYNILESGNICLKYKADNTTCEEELVVEVNGEVPESGTITLVNSVVKSVDVILSEKRIVKNDKGEIIYFPCTLISGDKNTDGSKYECEVKTGTKYNFYVLSQETDGTTNLIMDRNMCEDGTPTEEGKTCFVPYNSSGDTRNGGPVAAMTYLNNATSTWENIDNLAITYDDEKAFFTELKITGKARLPYYNEVSEYDSTSKTNAYLYDYLNLSETIQTNTISNIYGYWTLSSYFDSDRAMIVYYQGGVSSWGAGNSNNIGVRPVINLKL